MLLLWLDVRLGIDPPAQSELERPAARNEARTSDAASAVHQNGDSLESVCINEPC